MSKKIALVLIMIMLTNMGMWADVTTEEALEAGMPVWVIILIIFGVAALAGGVAWALAEADAPDDGVRLASTQTVNPVLETKVGPLINFLQHAEVGQTRDNGFYMGLRFQY